MATKNLKTLSPCRCKKCRDCTDFKNVVDLKNTGLLIYRHTARIESNKKQITNSPGAKTDDVFILHNTGNTEVTTANVFPSLDKRNINCQRCKSIIEHTQQLLKNTPKIEKNELIGVCDYCQKKGEFGKKCTECNKIVKKFRISKGTYKDENKDYIKSWLAKSHDVDKVLPDESEGNDLKSRIHSDFTIDSFQTDRKSKPGTVKSREPRTPSKMGIIPDSKHPYANSLKRQLQRMPRLNLSELSITWSSKRSSVSKDNDYDNIHVTRIYKSAENPYNDKNIQQTRKHPFRYPATREAGPGAKIIHDNLYFKHYDDSKMYGDRNFLYKPESKEIQLSSSLIKTNQADELSNAVTAIKEEYYYYFPKTKLPDKYLNTKRQLASSAELIKETQNMLKERESAPNEKKEEPRFKKNKLKQRKLSNKTDHIDKITFDYKDKITYDLKEKTAAKDGNKIVGKKDGTDENKKHLFDSKTKDYIKDDGDKKNKSAKDKIAKVQKTDANQDAEKQRNNREELLRKEKEDKERLKREKEEELKRIKEDKEKIKKEKEEQLRREKEEKEQQKKEKGDGKKDGGNADKAMLDMMKKGKEGKSNKEQRDANDDLAKRKQEEDLFKQIQKRLEEEMKRPMTDDHLVKIKEGPKTAPTNVSRLSQMNLTPMLYIKHRCAHKHNRNSTCAICQDSDLEIDVDNIIMKKKPEDVSEIIIGQRIIKCKSRKKTMKSKYCVPENVYKHEFIENDTFVNVAEENVPSASPETRATKSAR